MLSRSQDRRKRFAANRVDRRRPTRSKQRAIGIIEHVIAPKNCLGAKPAKPIDIRVDASVGDWLRLMRIDPPSG